MSELDTLEEKLASSVILFASKTNNGYILKRCSDSENRRIITITVGKWDNPEDWTIKHNFEHRVGLLEKGFDEVYNGTLHVSDSSTIRRLYMDFIKYMNSQGIPLVNNFEDTWKSDPRRYPI